MLLQWASAAGRSERVVALAIPEPLGEPVPDGLHGSDRNRIYEHSAHNPFYLQGNDQLERVRRPPKENGVLSLHSAR